MHGMDERTPDLDDITGWVDGMLTLPEVAKILRVAPRTLRKYINNGAIPSRLYSRVGGYSNGRLRFTADQVREIASTIWAGGDTPPKPVAPTGMVYRPRRSGRAS